MTSWRGPATSGGATTRRLRIRRWRDPRLLLGFMLILGATVAGAKVTAAADDRVAYWSLRSDVAPGDPVTRGDLVPTKVRLSGDVADRYVRTGEELAASLDDLVWAHATASGSLVEKSALVPRTTVERSELPLTVDVGAAPVDLARGDLVDVWVGPGPGDDHTLRAIRVLEGVRVLQAADGGGAARTVLVGVDRTRLARTTISTVAAGHVTLVRME